MLVALGAVVFGLALLVWSADRFVDGAAATADHFSVPPLLIGMVIVGFGTSAPEMAVSVLASYQGNPGLALGNAYGSNITNIALILGVAAIVCPITVHSAVLRKELPMLTAVTGLAIFQLWDGKLSRMDAAVLLAVFAALMAWSIHQGLKQRGDALGAETASELAANAMPIRNAMIWLVVGLVLLVVSSRILVWGSVEIAKAFGVSDLIIGLTIVAVGTSLPELASSVAAARKGQHDIALGNVLGSNMFNTLAVVGLAAVISPIDVPAELLGRDVMTMSLLTGSLFIICYGFGRVGRVNRYEAAFLLACFVAYTGYLAMSVFGHGA